MSIINKGTAFSNGEQLTADKLNNLVDLATFDQSATDSTSTTVNTSGQIVVADSGVSTAKILDDAVTTAKILDDNVTTAKILDSNVTTAKILDANVTKAKIEDVADYKVLGNVSGAAAAPAEVAILDEDDMVSDSDTSLATQQSIKAYVDSTAGGSSVIPYATFTDASGSTSITGTFGAYTEVDPNGIASMSGSTITLTSGTFLVSWNGSFTYSGSDYYTVTARYGSTIVQEKHVSFRSSSSAFDPFSASRVVTSAGSQTLSFYAQRNASGNSYVSFENLNITVIKIG